MGNAIALLLKAKYQSTLGQTIRHAYTELVSLMEDLVNRFQALPSDVQSSDQGVDFLFLLGSLERAVNFPIHALIFDAAAEWESICYPMPTEACLSDRLNVVFDNFWHVAVQTRIWSKNSSCSEDAYERWDFCWTLLGGIAMMSNDLVVALRGSESCWN